jgi:hypothetical protein
MLDEREREGTTEEYPHQRISVTFSIIVFTIYRDGSKFRFTLNRANAFLDMSLVLLLHLHNLHDKFTSYLRSVHLSDACSSTIVPSAGWRYRAKWKREIIRRDVTTFKHLAVVLFFKKKFSSRGHRSRTPGWRARGAPA